jgi:hypothetical protein
MRTFDPVTLAAVTCILAASEPETWRQRIGRWLRLPVVPAPVIVRAHHISAPFRGGVRRRERLAQQYALDHVRRVLHKHRTGEEIPGPVRKSRVRVQRVEPAQVIPFQKRA